MPIIPTIIVLLTSLTIKVTQLQPNEICLYIDQKGNEVCEGSVLGHSQLLKNVL